MVGEVDAVPGEQRARAFDGLPVLRIGVGWCIGDDLVFVYGLNDFCMGCGFLSRSQDIEFLAYGF